MITKYNFEIDQSVLDSSKKRLINQLWKLIPMKEHDEDWQKQLDGVINEITGLNKIFSTELNFLTLLSKLEGLYEVKDFFTYRKIVFESISLLGELYG